MTYNNEEEAELVNIDLQPIANVNYFPFNNSIVSPVGVFSPTFSTSPYYYFPSPNESTLFQIKTPTYYPFPNFNNTPTKTPTNISLQNPITSPFKIPTYSPIRMPTYIQQPQSQPQPQPQSQSPPKTKSVAVPIIPTPTRPSQDFQNYEFPKQKQSQRSHQINKANLKQEIKQKLIELSQMKNKYDQCLASQFLKSVKKKRNRRLNKKLTSINKSNSFHQMPQRKRQLQKKLSEGLPKKKKPIQNIKPKKRKILKNPKNILIQKNTRKNRCYKHLSQKRFKKNLTSKVAKKASFSNNRKVKNCKNIPNGENRFKKSHILTQEKKQEGLCEIEKEKETQCAVENYNGYIQEKEEIKEKVMDDNILIENSRDLFKLFIGVIWVISGGSTISKLCYYSDTIIFQISKSLNLKQAMVEPIKDQIKYLLTNSRRTFTEYILEILIGILSLNHSQNKQKIPQISTYSWTLLSKLALLQESNESGAEETNVHAQEKKSVQENLEKLYSQIFTKKILIYWFSKRFVGRLKPLFNGDALEKFFTNHLNAFGKSKFMLTCLVLSKNLQAIKTNSEKYFNLINLTFDSDPLNLYANNRTKKHKIIRALIVKFSLNDGEYWSILSQDYFHKMKFDHLNMFQNFPFNSIINDPKLNQCCGLSQSDSHTQTKRILACKGKKINSLINIDWILKK
ncbi:hypothetical protein M0812_06621 [Anaeramoeba flamelloides]|uniref:Uncharacterized protein n=1 Tax=Anaeramoeba flamelloides TaxID=1746091 RepID=A0AAV8AE11_9EUKA|nr:hypothetical protein M0812_06621 [Anaeramoeba flamelloides]